MKRLAFMILCLSWLGLLLLGHPTHSVENVASTHRPWQISVDAKDFKHSGFVESDMHTKVREVGNLSGRVTSSSQNSYIRGWVEYEVVVPTAGWYELLIQPNALGVEYIIDGKQSLYGNSEQKLSNLWLESGKHSIKLQRYIWTGFPPITGFMLRQSGNDITKMIQLEVADPHLVIRQSENLKLRIVSGGSSQGIPLNLRVTDKSTRKIERTYPINLLGSRKKVETLKSISFDREGIFELSLAVGDRPIAPSDVHPIEIVVVDTSPQPRTGGEIQKTLIQEIDCAKAAPDYTGSGGTEIVSTSFGRYRESADAGWLQQQHMSPIQSSWFAYKISVPQPGNAYVLEVDYPDDKMRTFAIAIRDSNPEVYPVAGGVDSGGEFLLTNSLQTHSMIFWPNSNDLRIVFMNAQTGLRAAAAKIRVYQVKGDIPLLNVPRSGGRTFANWYEEGLNFAAIYGESPHSVEAILAAAERWARSVAYIGGDMLVPTVAIYQMALYPSRYNIDFNDPGTPDFVRMIQLKCEKYGLKMVGQFHPEGRELEWMEGLKPTQRNNVLRDRNGKIASPAPPRHHPLHPLNQKWYVGMIGEFVDRYKDSPTLEGVNLRLLTWSNPALNNFHSLEWGYDDYTVNLFQQETGIRLPVVQAEDPHRYSQRYDWLMTHAKTEWITWRCQKIVKFYTKVRDRVRQSRPDLKVYSDVFFGFQDLQEAGIDVKMLSQIEHVRLINALHDYGRRYDGHIYGGTVNQQHRDSLLDPSTLKSMVSEKENGAFLFGAGYFESTEKVVPPEEIGFPATTKATWMAAVVNPAGRHALERWSLALAETDAFYLADGGNGYTLGQPLLRKFLQEYRYLPPVPFSPRKDARDPVAIWELTQTQNYLFYAVNRERYPVEVTLTFNTKGNIRRLSNQQAVQLNGNRLSLKLEPYELRVFTAPPHLTIHAVSMKIPEYHQNQVAQQVSWIQQFNRQVSQNKTCQQLTLQQRESLAQTTQTVSSYFQQHWLWHSRTGLERHNMMEIYRQCNQFPPALRSIANNPNLETSYQTDTA